MSRIRYFFCCVFAVGLVACDGLIADEVFSNTSTLPVADGLVAHFSASDISGLNDGDKISSWTDLSGNGNNLTQSTASQQPSYRDASNGLNGLPAVQFALGSAITGMSTPTITIAQRTIFVALEVLGSPPASLSPIFLHQDTVASNNYALTASTTYSLLTIATQTGGTASFASRMILSIVIGASTAELYVDGTQDVTLSSTGSSTTGNLFFGGDPTESLNGLIAEIAIFNRALTTAERQSVESYLNGRYSAF